MREVLGAVFLPWEEKFGHGSPPGSGILTLLLPSISKFGHSFRPESMGGSVEYCGFALGGEFWACLTLWVRCFVLWFTFHFQI